MNYSEKDKTINLDNYRLQKHQQALKVQAFQDLEKATAHSKHAPEKFLTAWKKGVMHVGSEFFIVTSDTVDTANDKWQLVPNITFIQQAIGDYNHGKQALLALMCSFYNAEEGQKLLEYIGTPNFVDALSILDSESTEIIAALWLNYSGW